MINRDISQFSAERHSPYSQPNVCGLISKISKRVRIKMFKTLMQLAQPTPETTVLDVGIGVDQREDSNFFEKLYPYPNKITAVGVEEASFLEKEFPGLKFIKADGANLPFPDKSFDLVVSFATLEHVGSRDRQCRFIRELCRVGGAVCIVTPNRWYPLEFHTLLPFVHWLPPGWFRSICRWAGKDFLGKESNLNLLSEKDILKMFPAGAKIYRRHFRLFGLVSNLMFNVYQTQI